MTELTHEEAKFRLDEALAMVRHYETLLDHACEQPSEYLKHLRHKQVWKARGILEDAREDYARTMEAD